MNQHQTKSLLKISLLFWVVAIIGFSKIALANKKPEYPKFFIARSVLDSLQKSTNDSVTNSITDSLQISMIDSLQVYFIHYIIKGVTIVATHDTGRKKYGKNRRKSRDTSGGK